jgi:hypothetical protein
VLRTEKRMSKGISFLLSYTLSRAKDNTGGLNGTGGRDCQAVDPCKDAYSLSPLDQTHRFIGAFTAELPFGRGRMLLGHPVGAAEKVLDAVVGGWQLGGIWTITSGRPIVLSYANQQIANSYGRILTTFGSYATSNHNLGDPNFSSNSQVFVPVGVDLSTVSVRRIDPNLLSNAGLYQRGDLLPVYGGIRQPAFFNTDLSLMKNFSFSEGKRFFQLRVEASNAFNQRGFPNYQTQVGNPNFGLAIADPNQPWRSQRIMQMSGRFVF